MARTHVNSGSTKITKFFSVEKQLLRWISSLKTANIENKLKEKIQLLFKSQLEVRGRWTHLKLKEFKSSEKWECARHRPQLRARTNSLT
jgi:hypothetical protein